MTLNLIFLPLLGGYLFFSIFNGTRYRASDFPAQRIIFPSAAFGLGFLVLARLLVLATDYFERKVQISLDHTVGIAMPAAAFVVLISAIFCISNLNKKLGKHSQGKKTQKITHRSFSAVAAESLFGETARKLFQFVAAFIGGGFLIRASFDASPLQLSDWLLGVLVYSLVLLVVSFLIAIAIHRFALQPILETLFSASVVILILVSLLGVAVAKSHNVREFWKTFSPVQDSGIPILSVVLAITTCWLLNRILTPLGASAFHFATERLDQMQRLFYQSALYKQLIQVNLTDNKVYVGWVRSLPANTESADGYFLFLPLKSGYRDKDSKELHLPTDYADVLSRLAEKANSADRLNKLLELYYKVIKTENVATAGLFDLDDFQRFNDREVEQTENPPAPLKVEVTPGDPD